MTSAGAPQPWPPPPAATDGKSYRVCTQGICSTECPQYCGYFLLPPPPPFFLLDNPDDGGASSSSRSRAVSPLMAALIAVLAAAFLLLLYYTVISRLCRRRPARRTRVLDDDGVRLDPLSLGPSRPVSGAGGGLDDSFIRQITVFRYRRGDGLIEGSDCAVCLSEFAEGESLRLMPNCQHAFHIPCIDTWLKTQSSCPLCRAGMDDPVVPPRKESGAAGGVSLAAMRVERGNDAVLVVREVGGGGDREGGVIVCHEVAAAAVEEEEERESPDRGGGGDGDELGKRDATADHR